MKVTQVSLAATEAATLAGRPALTPELLAACGARYSRSNEGLETILSRVDPANVDRSVDSIFRMVDYGHQSIADMAPVAMFMDGISLWLAYHLWTLCPTAAGQESSTRYIRLSPEGLIAPADLGIPEAFRGEWDRAMGWCFGAYAKAVEFWEAIATADPEVARVPAHLVSDPSEKAGRQVARMRRNYGFDRARYFLPMAAATNVMLVMSARGWVQLCQQLLSHALPEAVRLGERVRDELSLVTPRLLRHATRRESIVNGLGREFAADRQRARQEQVPGDDPDRPPTAFLEVQISTNGLDAAGDLSFHDNRYAWIGEGLRRTVVRFGWEAIAMGEIRDLNRHRTGTKHCPLVPRGFYCARDQMPAGKPNGGRELLAGLAAEGGRLTGRARELLTEGHPWYVYWTTLGAQYRFEHVTTADKFLYEAELRTGTGAHYRYADHLRAALALWYERFPETKGLVLEGSAEPE